MAHFRPKYITFDCYGTLTRFQMGELAREIFSDRIPANALEAFIRDLKAYRFDEVLGAWKPYSEVLCNAVERTCKRWGICYSQEEGLRFTRRFPHGGRIRTCQSRSHGWPRRIRWWSFRTR